MYCVFQVPAPERGEIVRQMGEALRDKKNLLGKMVRSLQEEVFLTLVSHSYVWITNDSGHEVFKLFCFPTVVTFCIYSIYCLCPILKSASSVLFKE